MVFETDTQVIAHFIIMILIDPIYHYGSYWIRVGDGDPVCHFWIEETSSLAMSGFRLDLSSGLAESPVLSCSKEDARAY